MQHYPVLKIVTGQPDWDGGNANALPNFQGQPRIFLIAGQDITIGEDAFPSLSLVNFHLLSSDDRLKALRSGNYSSAYQVEVDPKLLGNLPSRDPRLITRVRFTRGEVKALISEYCEFEPLKYLAEANTVGPGPTGCPDEGIAPQLLAEEVVARFSDTGQPLTVHFREWGGITRTLVVRPGASGGVRIEFSQQMTDAAKHIDSRDEDAEIMCKLGNLRDYLWYYDLRDSAMENCLDLQPAFFPCILDETGGTKCPEHNWGP